MEGNHRERQEHPTTQKFVALLESAATRSVAFVQEDEFVQAYKTLFKAFKPIDPLQQPPLAGSSGEGRKTRETLHAHVLNQIKDAIAFVVEDEDLDRKFVELDRLKTEFSYASSGPAWRPPGDAELHMKPFDVVAKVEVRDSLTRLVKAEREKLNILRTRIEGKRKKFNMLNGKIKEKAAKLGEEMMAHRLSDCC